MDKFAPSQPYSNGRKKVLLNRHKMECRESIINGGTKRKSPVQTGLSTIAKLVRSKLDLDASRYCGNKIVAEGIRSIVTIGDTILRNGSRRAARQNANCTREPPLDVLRGAVGRANTDRPAIRLSTIAMACATIPGQADSTTPLVVELVPNAARDRPSVLIQQIERGQLG